MPHKQFTKTEREIINHVIEFEHEVNHELPINSFYKSIALKVSREVLGQNTTWSEVKYIFEGN